MDTIDAQDTPYSGVPHESDARTHDDDSRTHVDDARAPVERATFEVAGEPYQPAGDAARAMLAAAPDLSPSGAYGRLRRGAAEGTIRTVRVNRGHSWYHRGDVLALAAQMRGA